MSRFGAILIPGVMAAVFVSHPASAAEPAFKAIVLAGAKLPKRIAPELEKLKLKLRDFVPADGFPRVMESKDVDGLKKGFEVIVLGFCPVESADALRIADLVEQAAKHAVKGAYGRTVHGKLDESCPRLRMPRPTDAEGERQWAAVERDPDSLAAQSELGFYFSSIGDLDSAEYLALRVLSRDPKHVDALSLAQKIAALRTD